MLVEAVLCQVGHGVPQHAKPQAQVWGFANYRFNAPF